MLTCWHHNVDKWQVITNAEARGPCQDPVCRDLHHHEHWDYDPVLQPPEVILWGLAQHCLANVECWMCQQVHNATEPSTQLPWCSCSQGRCSSQDWWRDHCHCQSPGRAAPGSADLEWVQSYTMLHNCVATDMLHNQVRLTFNEVILGWIIS